MSQIVLARDDSWILDGLTSMSKESDSSDCEFWCDCGSAIGAEQSTFIICEPTIYFNRNLLGAYRYTNAKAIPI